MTEYIENADSFKGGCPVKKNTGVRISGVIVVKHHLLVKGGV